MLNINEHALTREETVTWVAAIAAALVCGSFLALRSEPTGFRYAMALGWLRTVFSYAAEVGITFWLFAIILPTLLPYGLLTRDRGVIRLFNFASVMSGSLGTVIGLCGTMKTLDANSIKSVLAVTPYLVEVFASTAVGIVFALLGSALAFMAGLNVFDESH